jgi:diaminopimelate decarboxylase
MPMSPAFADRLLLRLPGIIEHFGTPFHIYDDQGIVDTGNALKSLFRDVRGYQQFFAVKALPNPAILKIIHKLGFGLDCSSPSELILGRRSGFRGEQIMFSSNNTTADLFRLALSDGGCILNIDDISMIDTVADFPDLICFRYNPGEKRTGNRIIGVPVEAKYGFRDDQIVKAYEMAIARGARRFGLHTMIVSNERNYQYMVETVRMLLDVADTITLALGINFEFINISGGVGIPYRPEDTAFDMPGLAREAGALLDKFKQKYGYAPALFTEFGRYMTGPHGALVAKVINRMSKYREYVGVDASTMSANPRPAIYGAYHHITIADPQGKPRVGTEEIVDVVGPLCENNDKFAVQRPLPKAEIGDIMIQHDTGAHCYAMAGNYNGWLRPQELLLRADGSVEMIRKAETIDNLFTTLDFKPKIMKSK